MHIWIGVDDKVLHVEEFGFRIGGAKKIFDIDSDIPVWALRLWVYGQCHGTRKKPWRVESPWADYSHIYNVPDVLLENLLR